MLPHLTNVKSPQIATLVTSHTKKACDQVARVVRVCNQMTQNAYTMSSTMLARIEALVAHNNTSNANDHIVRVPEGESVARSEFHTTSTNCNNAATVVYPEYGRSSECGQSDLDSSVETGSCNGDATTQTPMHVIYNDRGVVSAHNNSDHLCDIRLALSIYPDLGPVMKRGHNEDVVMVTDLLLPCEESKHLHRCAVIANHEAQVITFVTVGTRFDSLKWFAHDFADDLRMMAGLNPKKLASAQALNRVILENLGEKAADYKFHYVGHSIGGFIADLSAAHMAALLHDKGLLEQNKISTKTFDNPGALKGVHSVIAEHTKTNGSSITADKVREMVDFVAINNALSVFSLRDQAGALHQLPRAHNNSILGAIERKLAECCRFNPLTVASNMKDHQIHAMMQSLERHLPSFGSTVNIKA